MTRGRSAALAVMLAACTSGGSGPGPSTATAPGSCTGEGATYDVSKSRFAFGGEPTSEQVGGDTRWTGPGGVLVIRANGHVSASSNASPSAASDWSDDADALAAHVRAYFVELGVAECQIARTNVFGGNVGRMIGLQRGISGIPLPESMAHARINRDDQTTTEGFYWPTVPDDVVAAARAFRDRLATADGLAAYKAKLPPNAQGDGTVVLHHRSAVLLPGRLPKEFIAMPTWDVLLSDAHSSALPSSFDEEGAPVDIDW